MGMAPVIGCFVAIGELKLHKWEVSGRVVSEKADFPR